MTKRSFGWLRTVGAVLLLVAVSGCSYIRDIPTLLEATQFFGYLTEMNAIPGITLGKGDSFSIHVDPLGSAGTYPVAVRAIVTQAKTDLKYSYRMEKAKRGAPWVLVRGWSKDANGQQIWLALPSADAQAKANEQIGKQ